MRNVLLLVVSFILLGSVSQAAVLNLKDGRSVTGTIKQKAGDQVQMEVDGVTMTYFTDEIKDIDGNPLTVPAPPTPVATAAPKNPQITAAKVSIMPPVATPVTTKEDPAQKRLLILKFIDVFGTRKAMAMNVENMLNNLAEQKPEEALKIRQRFKIDEVIERLIPLYDKYFTSEDLKSYIDFYSSEKGQKLITGIGSIMRESIQVGSAYLKEKFPDFDK